MTLLVSWATDTNAIVAMVATAMRLLMYVMCDVLFFICITVIAMGVNVKHLDKPYVVRGTGCGG
jgi:hypothetical protein